MKTILIAEGDDRLAELFADLFALEGWTVATCNAGQRAVDALAGSAPYDAVLVNNRLAWHERRGADHADSRAGPPENVPIVMVTGSGDVDVVAAALAAGADDVLYKPVDVVILVDTVNKCVERRRQQDT